MFVAFNLLSKNSDGRGGDGVVQDKRQEGQRRHHGVRQTELAFVGLITKLNRKTQFGRA